MLAFARELFQFITFVAFSLAYSKNELMQWRGVRRLSVCL